MARAITILRQTLALALLKHRSDAKVLLVAADSLDGEVTDFGPDLLMRSDNDGAAPEYLNAIACRIEIHYSDGMGARVNLDGQVREIENISMDDLFTVLDEVEASVSREPTGP